MISRWQDLFDHFDGPTDFGKAIGVSRQAAFNMMNRKSVPPRWWVVLIECAKQRKINGVTYDALARLAATPHNGEMNGRPP